MFPHFRHVIIAVAFSFSLPTWSCANGPFRYPEAKHGKGELKYINEIPVLTIEGTPEEMGDQLGTLALKPTRQLTKLADDFIAKHGWEHIYALVLKTGHILVPRFPPDHVEELDAAANASGWPRDLLVFGNTITDLRRIIQCSAVIVEAGRSTTGGPLFGRNLDWTPVAQLHEYTLVVICRPKGKRAFASITFPGLLGCSSGMNDAGLAVAMLDVSSTKDGSASFNPLGMPTNLALRRVLEECSSIEEAATLLKSVERASKLNVAICDWNSGAVLEVTPKNVVIRASEDGVCLCTNHFRSPKLATPTECWRYDTLAKSIDTKEYAILDIAERLHSVNQGPSTLQTMIFEPTVLRLHLAFGEGPATRLPMRSLDLNELFRNSGESDSVERRHLPERAAEAASPNPGV